MKNISKEELKEILDKHKMWLKDEEGGERADLSNADLSSVNLWNANLIYANLSGADLSDADLKCANLSNTDLKGTNLWDADLSGADLKYIKTSIRTIGYNLACPEEGSFTGYKKADGCIVKLLILEDAKRSSATTFKCRCDKAKVLEIKDIDTGELMEKARSNHNPNFIYKVGEIVTVENFDDDRWRECAPGIHFFMNKENALNY